MTGMPLASAAWYFLEVCTVRPFGMPFQSNRDGPGTKRKSVLPLIVAFVLPPKNLIRSSICTRGAPPEGDDPVMTNVFDARLSAGPHTSMGRAAGPGETMPSRPSTLLQAVGGIFACGSAGP